MGRPYLISSILLKFNKKDPFKVFISKHQTSSIPFNNFHFAKNSGFHWSCTTIFTDVFMNDYVNSGSSFIFTRLGYYGFHVMKGMISARWLLIVMCVIGFLFTLRKYTKWSSLMLFMAICYIPMIIVYIRGDNAPLRIFVVWYHFFH